MKTYIEINNSTYECMETSENIAQKIKERMTYGRTFPYIGITICHEKVFYQDGSWSQQEPDLNYVNVYSIRRFWDEPD